MAMNKKRLIVVVDEDILEDELPEKIKNYIKNFTYLTKDCPFFMKRITYRLAQNKLGGPDDEVRPLLVGDVDDYGAVN